MMQILDNEKEQRIIPVFRLAFRPFFLAGSAFSVVAMLVWALFWSGNVNVSALMYGNPLWWHSHEMLIGFSGAIIVGFLLTAVQNWTGNPGVRGWKLASIFIFWLIARVGLLVGTPNIALMIADLIWMPLAAYFLAKPIIIRKQWNNLFFAPLIILLTYLNVLYHFNILGIGETDLRSVSFMVVMVVAVIVLVVGGRVIPFFTWRGTNTEQITRVKWVELGALIPSWLLLVNVLLPIPELISQFTLPVLLVATGGLHLIRFARWRTLSTLKTPLLWLLHFAYMFMIIGMLLLAVHLQTGAISYSVALHFITVGGIGCMILAMIARVSLGHTGRPLKINRVMIAAFVALLASAIVRTVVVILFPALILNAYIISAILWAVAFMTFTVVYFPILTKPRLDGRPG
ncbi:NnrS family protein [Photobacterium sp. SDRW27]|uniref:NnrS family protein n=1 Tax=Photobacterium obscurum TaxID=2829490 RepID=UPI0022434B92|nr:NnrS family protein [Photobacterium obscurum]MCW8329378.1 NnrS family protein [Photobacterium obscurum]